MLQNLSHEIRGVLRNGNADRARICREPSGEYLKSS